MENKKSSTFKAVIMVVLLTLLTVSCGKDVVVNKKGSNNSSSSSSHSFAKEFFEKSNLPYTALSEVDVQNTSDEYLLYIEDGAIYRTINDYLIVIAERKKMHESDKMRQKNYSGEMYNIFDNDSSDMLKCCAYGDYALLCSPSTIPDWDNDILIQSFIKYSRQYNESNE